MALNRGEWSEIYAILCMLVCPDLSIANSKLEEIAKDLYEVKKIFINNTEGIIEYCLQNNENVQILYENDISEIVSIVELAEHKNKIYNAIKNAPTGEGAFIIEGMDGLLAKLTKGKNIKANSFEKEDLEAVVFDKRLGQNKNLKYSIKSSLGSPATILNSSLQTNFRYFVDGLNDEHINVINSIETRTKLVDRMRKIFELGGKISFDKVINENFNYNLKMIDSNMPAYLGKVLLDSYSSGSKDLKELFLNSNQFEDENYALKKLGDFLEGISFGFFPSLKWDGVKNVNGGLVLVKQNGNVVVLDLIYFRNEVLKYLINETKLDSPSSTRYNMLHLQRDPDTNRIYFTLNLQIRYKN